MTEFLIFTRVRMTVMATSARIAWSLSRRHDTNDAISDMLVNPQS